MKIRRVQSFLLSYPMPEPVLLTYYGGKRTIVKRDSMLIRVEGEGNLVGYAPGQGSEVAQKRITDIIGPFLEGRLLADPDALRVIFIEGPGRDPEVLKTYSAVEVALYDLLGKQLGAPISELVGGRVRDRIRLYGSAGMYQPPEAYAAEAAGIASLGFRAYKMRPALGPEDDLRTVKLMRDAVGPNVDLMVDAHSWWRMGDRSYSPETIEKLAEQMAEYDIAWLEEPLPPDDHAAYRKLKASGILPVASGEHESSEETFRDLIADCVDYVQMDIVCQGGYPTCRRILGDVERSNLAFAFHSWGTDLEVLAAAHLGICWPETVTAWLEYPVYSTSRLKTMYPFPLATEILAEPLDIQEGGELIVPTKPGLGIDVNEDVISKYPWLPGPWSFFELISPPETFAVTADHSLKWAGDSLPGASSEKP